MVHRCGASTSTHAPLEPARVCSFFLLCFTSLLALECMPWGACNAAERGSKAQQEGQAQHPSCCRNNSNPLAAPTIATTTQATPDKRVTDKRVTQERQLSTVNGQLSTKCEHLSRASVCLRRVLEYAWARPQVRATQSLWWATPSTARLHAYLVLSSCLAQRTSMEYMQSLQLLKPGLLGQRPLVVITRDPQKVVRERVCVSWGP